MDTRPFRDVPILGATIFAEPQGGRIAWAWVVFVVGYTVFMSFDRGLTVGLLSGLPLVAIAVPQVLPEDQYRLAVGLRILGLVSFVALWVGILLYFPDAPTFFAGDW